MKPALAEFEIKQLLAESGHARVYAAESERDGRACVAKVFDIGDETVAARVRHEFELIRALDIEGVVRAESLQRVGDQLVLVLERAPGVDLKTLIEDGPLSLARFFEVSVQLAEILAQTHARRIIHRDIKPANLLYDPDSGRAHIADFGISVLLESERRHIYDEQVLVGTLPYISPEQTGRTNRKVDFRSDLYSLGVTFYELLTGRRPFDNYSPLELIHAHLARTPSPPKQLRPEIPEALSRVVMKLLAKAPERRYQTAAGLADDLRELQRDYDRGADSVEFELGRTDRVTTLQLPQQVYGRALEQTRLRELLEEITALRTRKTLALLGPLGVGKSALLDMLEAAIVEFGGYTLRGKFDPFRELPHSAFVEAFTGLFEQLLTESDARLERWRRRLLEGLGQLVGVACELVPTLSLIVGHQEPVMMLAPVEARNRLELTVDRLLSTMSEDGPVVLILDDLHQAEQSSVELVESLSRGTSGPLLIAATARDTQLERNRPLQLLLDAFDDPVQPGTELMRLGPLDSAAIEALLSDALRSVPGLPTLAAIILRKTGGVPLFIAQLLSDLVARELLRPSVDQATGATIWSWDRAEVDAARVPDDAVAVMRERLDDLSEEARELLGRAACLGARFELERLAAVSKMSAGAAVTSSFPLIEAGLLVTVGHSYRFAHESIQAAASQLLDPDERRAVHWIIGKQLIDSHEASGTLDDHLFEIAEHLIAGADDDLDAPAARALAQLELRAGQRALDSAAYQPALRYFEHGLELLDMAAPSPELRFGLEFGHAQALALANQRERANRTFDQLLERELSDAQLGLVAARRIRLLQLENRQPDAIVLGRAALAKLGAPLPSKVSFARASICLTRAWLALRNLELEAAMAIPACDDARSSALIEIIAQLKYPAFITDTNLFIYLSGLHALMLGKLGFHDSTPVAIADVAISVSGGLDKAADAHRMIELALRLCPRSNRSKPARVNILGVPCALSWHRTHPFGDFLGELEQTYPEALELGEFDHGAFLASFPADMHLEIGTHLAVLDRKARQLELDHGRRGAVQMQNLAWIVDCTCTELLGTRAEPDEWRTRGLSELTADKLAARGGLPTNEYTAYANATMLHLLLGDRAAALEVCVRATPEADKVVFNSWLIPRMYAAGCVAYYSISAFEGSRPSTDAAFVRRWLKLLRSWAKDCPENYSHYLDLVLGMRAADKGQRERAIDHFDRAWSQARARGCRWIEGLAAEASATTLERQGRSSLVEGAWRRAWDAYAAWGAEALLDRLREAKPELFATSERRRSSTASSIPETTTGTSGIGSSSQNLDLEAVLRSVGLITEELQLDQVITRLLDAALTTVGADHGLLLLDRQGELALVAEARSGDDSEVLATQPTLHEARDRVPSSVVNFVVRTRRPLIVDDASNDHRFHTDPYLTAEGIRSLLVTPIIRDELLGVLVLENRLGSHGFSPASVETLRLITSQAASTLDNARLHAALRHSEARWRSLVDGAPDRIVLIDEHAELVFGNRGHEGSGDLDFTTELSEPARAAWSRAVERVLATGEMVELELELERSASEELPRWLSIRLAPIEIELANVDLGASMIGRLRRNAVAIATDISDRKRAEVERQLLETQLRQQQRLESLGTLASGVAHEINNPIQGIMNYAELIAKSANDYDTVVEFAGEIAHETERVATIVRNLLAFSRQERDTTFEATDVRTLVEGTLSLIHTVMRKDHISIDVEVQPLRVRCRTQQIQQIIMNLVTNARDALNTRYPGYDERKRIEIRSQTRDDGRVRLTVTDNGPGIPQHVLTHIFDPFYTTKGRDNGTGLGLSVSHGIAHEHGGEISVETKIGQGTSFHLDLPVA